jgi:hypothetical protein
VTAAWGQVKEGGTGVEREGGSIVKREEPEKGGSSTTLHHHTFQLKVQAKGVVSVLITPGRCNTCIRLEVTTLITV